MTYTIAVIEGMHTGRRAEIWASGKWRTLWIFEGDRHYHTCNMDRDEAERRFYELCKYATEYLYSFDKLVEMMRG